MDKVHLISQHNENSFRHIVFGLKSVIVSYKYAARLQFCFFQILLVCDAPLFIALAKDTWPLCVCMLTWALSSSTAVRLPDTPSCVWSLPGPAVFLCRWAYRPSISGHLSCFSYRSRHLPSELSQGEREGHVHCRYTIQAAFRWDQSQYTTQLLYICLCKNGVNFICLNEWFWGFELARVQLHG